MLDVNIPRHLEIQGLRGAAKAWGGQVMSHNTRACSTSHDAAARELGSLSAQICSLEAVGTLSLQLQVHQRFNLPATASEFTRQSSPNPTPVRQWYASPASEHKT